MDYTPPDKQRFAQLKPGANGKLETTWQLTDTALLDSVKLTLPPMHVIPIRVLGPRVGRGIRVELPQISYLDR